MAEQKRIVVVDPQPLFRDGLRALLEATGDFAVVGESGDGLEAIAAIASHRPDAVIIELDLPSMYGTELIREARRAVGSLAVLVVSAELREHIVIAAFEAGAVGFISKDSDFGELVVALRAVLRGRRYVAPDLSGRIVEALAQGRRLQPEANLWDRLTRRERVVLKLVAEGHSNRSAAEALCISVKTVEKHRANLMKKLGVHNAAALTLLAIENGLVSGAPRRRDGVSTAVEAVA